MTHRSFLQRFGDLLRLHGLATAEIGEEVIAGLDAALLNEVPESVLVRKADEVVLVMRQRKRSDGGDNPDGDAREEDGEPERNQEIHVLPLRIEAAYQDLGCESDGLQAVLVRSTNATRNACTGHSVASTVDSGALVTECPDRAQTARRRLKARRPTIRSRRRSWC